MRRSTVIAHCLVNSSIVNRLEDAEHLVRRVFLDEFPDQNLASWDREMDDRTAENIIRNVGRAMWINVRRFIEDLEEIW